MAFLQRTSRQNGCSDQQIRPPQGAKPPTEDPFSVAFLSFVGTTYNRINRMLSEHDIKTVGILPSFLRFVKDDLALRRPGL
jgi:hypothetical protein